MDLYEYQGKQLFKQFGIPVSEGRLATTPEEARAAAEELGGQTVVKAQVLTGGRGKAGGVKLADDPADAERKAGEIIGLDIRGHVVGRVWIETASDIAKEYYLSVTFDRGAKQPLFMFTTQGGVEIEEVAANDPDALVRLHVDPLEGYQPWIARRLVYGAGVEDRGDHARSAGEVDLLQHLRRDHALRRGRARHPGGARPVAARHADRRPPRRHERRGGTQDPRRGRRLEPPRRADHARRGSQGRGA